MDTKTIPVPEAAEGTRYWREYYARIADVEESSKIFRGFFIPLEDLTSLLTTKDITGVRAYFALKERAESGEIVPADDVHIFLVPVSDNIDICESPMGTSNICNFTSPCPNVCDIESPLYATEID